MEALAKRRETLAKLQQAILEKAAPEDRELFEQKLALKKRFKQKIAEDRQLAAALSNGGKDIAAEEALTLAGRLNAQVWAPFPICSILC